MRKIRKGDEVVVHLRPRQGSPRHHPAGARRRPRLLVEGINRVKKHTEGQPAGRQAGRHRREGDAARRLQGGDLERRGARKPTASASRRSPTASACASSSRLERCSMPNLARLDQHYREKIVPKLKQELRLANVMEVPRISKITINMGVGEAAADRKLMDAAVADLTKITGQKPLIDQGQQGDRDLQAAPGPADRRQGDAARRAHVRVPRPADQHRDAAHPRLPRRLAALVRRPWQLQPGHQGTDHLPRDPVRPDRPGAWHGHHDYDDRAGTTGRAEHCSRHSTSRSGSKKESGTRLWRRRTWWSARSAAPKS